MTRSFCGIVSICAVTLLVGSAGLRQASTVSGKIPVARRREFFGRLHDVSIRDPYRWLEDQWSTETRSWVDAEMAYSRPLLTNLPSYRRVEKRSRDLFNIDQVSGIPTVIGGKLYYARRPKDAERFVI